MTVIIYKPTKSAMQSGRGKTKQWLLEYPSGKKNIDPLTGWTGSSDANQHIKIYFDTKEQAISFATKQKFDFQLIEPNIEKPPTQQYEDNFK